MITIIWQLLIGLGIFLFGMSQLETGIKLLSGASLRRWIPLATNTPVTSSACGVVVTAVLQSSSMVSLLVLAFASAGLIPLMNAVGVLLGANLGTTATGWVVATIGFKLDLEAMAIPLTGLASAVVVASDKMPRIKAAGTAFLGLGLLLLGLSLMKDSVADLPQQWDISQLQGLSPWVYFIVGALITALIQSSSAAMMMTLTALNAELIALPEAIALVIGADLGTTSTTILGSLTGSPVKKQLAFSHCFYNLVVDIAAFLILLPFAGYLLAWLDIDDPLYGLVAFHSFMNLLGLLVFLPLLKYYSRWIENLFRAPVDSLDSLAALPEVIPEAALPVVEKQVAQLWQWHLCNLMAQFQISPRDLKLADDLSDDVAAELEGQSFISRYEAIKGAERKILQLSAAVQRESLNETQSQQLSELLQVGRALSYAAKTLKDIEHTTGELLNDTDELGQQLLLQQQQYLQQQLAELVGLVTEPHERDFVLESIEDLQKLADQHQQQMDQLVYHRALTESSLEVSSLLNINRELSHAAKETLRAIAVWQRCQSGSLARVVA
jgi:phosphate:Na+ symporter